MPASGAATGCGAESAWGPAPECPAAPACEGVSACGETSLEAAATGGPVEPVTTCEPVGDRAPFAGWAPVADCVLFAACEPISASEAGRTIFKEPSCGASSPSLGGGGMAGNTLGYGA